MNTAALTYSPASRWRQAMPRRSIALTASLLWSIACALAAYAYLVFTRGFMDDGQIIRLMVIYALGGFTALYPSLYIARLMAPRSRWTRFFLFLFLTVGATLVLTGGFFALYYRQYYAQWHAPLFSRIWFWQQFFTLGGALYQYAVLGLRVYMPWALAALVVIALWVNRTDR